MSSKRWMCRLVLVGMTYEAAVFAQGFTTVVNFDVADGNGPLAGLVQGLDGNLYGTTAYGGSCTLSYLGCGTVFKMTPGGRLTTLHVFTGPDGANPYSGLALDSQGNLFGTTGSGGAGAQCTVSGGCGTVFEITPSGSLTTLYNFCSLENCADGYSPYGGLIEAQNQEFYGTTELGGASGNYGTVFKITSAGVLTTLHTFGGPPGPLASLVQATNGDIYGTTGLGGKNGNGTVFKMTPGGTLTIIHSFDGTDGDFASGGLVEGSGGILYGTTQLGGTSTNCSGGCGTVFGITLSGAFTSLHSFEQSDGFTPSAGLIRATDGNLYGSTVEGGYDYLCPGGCGTIFQITPGGVLTTLDSLTEFSQGSDIVAPLVQDTDGTFYGTCYVGGGDGAGTVFSVSTGLAAFVETLPGAGKAGAVVRILGTNLTGATSVTFNGTPAVFEVVRASEIAATIPSGATSGTVQVSTPSGTLLSNVPFEVR